VPVALPEMVCVVVPFRYTVPLLAVKVLVLVKLPPIERREGAVTAPEPP